MIDRLTRLYHRRVAEIAGRGITSPAECDCADPALLSATALRSVPVCSNPDEPLYRFPEPPIRSSTAATAILHRKHEQIFALTRDELPCSHASKVADYLRGLALSEPEERAA